MQNNMEKKFKLLKIINDNKDSLVYFSSPAERTIISLFEHISSSPEDINFITAGELNKFFAKNTSSTKFVPVLRYADSEEVFDAILDLYDLRAYTAIMNNQDFDQLVQEGCIADVAKLFAEIEDIRALNRVKAIVASAVMDKYFNKAIDITTLIEWQRLLPEYKFVDTDVRRYL